MAAGPVYTLSPEPSRCTLAARASLTCQDLSGVGLCPLSAQLTRSCEHSFVIWHGLVFLEAFTPYRRYILLLAKAGATTSTHSGSWIPFFAHQSTARSECLASFSDYVLFSINSLQLLQNNQHRHPNGNTQFFQLATCPQSQPDFSLAIPSHSLRSQLFITTRD